jgi:hypothetical protein
MSVITGYVGPNGSGKSLAAVIFSVVPALAEGRPVVSTMPINSPLYVPLESSSQIPHLRSCLLLLDEISSCFPSRSAMSVPPELIRVLNQLRKVDVEVVWTGPHWSRADSALRQVTQRVCLARGFFPDTRRRGQASLLRPSGPALDRLTTRWPSNRAFYYKFYDAVDFENFTQATSERLKPKRRVLYWRPWGLESQLYDSLAPVSLLDHVDAVGACLVCGGSRSRPKCSCGSRGHE